MVVITYAGVAKERSSAFAWKETRSPGPSKVTSELAVLEEAPTITNSLAGSPFSARSGVFSMAYVTIWRPSPNQSPLRRPSSGICERPRASSLLSHRCQDGKQRIPAGQASGAVVDAGASPDHPDPPTIDHRRTGRGESRPAHLRIFPKNRKTIRTGGSRRTDRTGAREFQGGTVRP